jgi:hypothetical protein
MNGGHVSLVSMRFSVKFCGDKAGGHCRDGHQLCGANHIHFGVIKFHLSGVNIIDQFVAVHKIDANNIVIQFGDHIYRVC